MGRDETEWRKRALETYYGFYERLKKDMHTETVTVTPKYINQPKPGGKMGNIKGADGTVIFMWPDKLSNFQAGQTYQVEIEVDQTDRGTFRKLSKVLSQRTPQQAPNGETSTSHAKEIFVTGVVGRAMGSGKFGPTDIGILTAAAKAAYEEAFEGKQEPPSGGIPYDDAPPHEFTQ